MKNQKKKLRLLVAAAAACLLTACGMSEKDDPEESIYQPRPMEGISGQQSGESFEADASQDDSVVYTGILAKYGRALREEWNMEKLIGEGMSVLAAYCYEKDPLENVGFAFLDLNGDGENELLIGAIDGDEFVNQAIFEMYILQDGTPVQVFSGQERDMYYLCGEEAGGYLITNTASAGMGQSAWYSYILDGDELSVVQAVLYVQKEDSTEEWYMAYDRDWDTGNDTVIDKELAESVIDSMKTSRVLPDYCSFADNEADEGYKITGLIEDQSFEVELDDWGKVTFVSIAPENSTGAPQFALVKDGKIIYTFPGAPKGTADQFLRVSAVAFQDYNEDGKKDVIVLVQYGEGEHTWNEPQLFLQENPDNLFYQKFPDASGYKVETAAGQQGVPFYRDTLLEEYLGKQRLTDSIANITGTWDSYCEYVESLFGE